MKKQISILLTICSAIIAIIGMTTVSLAADATKLPSIFTPTRTGIEFTEGISGFSYPSFNNFTSNPNIDEGGRLGDERQFTLGKLQCRDGGTTCTQCTTNPADPYCKYYDTLGIGDGEQLEAGDKIRFEIYFHNNGSDPYDDNTSKNSPNAKNAKVGIDVTNISRISSDPVNTIRPIGFITADNNKYYNLTGSYANKNGVEGIEIRDDMQAFIDSSLENVSMEVVPGSAILKMLTSGTNENQKYDFLKTIPEGEDTYIQFKMDNGTVVPVTVTAFSSRDLKKMWVEFDELPGCFRYSGLAYFDAIIKDTPTPPPNDCTSLEFINSIDPSSGEDVTLSCNAEAKWALFKLDLDFSQSPEPSTQKIKFTSADPKATISLPPYYLETSFPVTETFSNFEAEDNSIIGMYYGTGNLSAVYIDEDGTESSICRDGVETCDNECNAMCLSKPTSILPGTFSEFTATTSDYYGDTWNKDVTYSVQDGYGKFYKKFDYNNDGTINDIDIWYQIRQDFPESNPVKNTAPTGLCNGINQASVLELDPGKVSDIIDSILSGSYTQEGLFDGIIPTNIQTDKENKIDSLKDQPAARPQALSPSKYGMGNVFLALTPGVTSTSFGSNTSQSFNTNSPAGAVVNPNILTPEILENFVSGTQIVVPQGEAVWFYAIKSGENVITAISENDTDNLNCTKKASIQSVYTPICQNMQVEVTDQSPNSEKNIECLEVVKQLRIDAKTFTGTDGITYTKAQHKLKVRWTTPEANGRFKIDDPGVPQTQEGSPTITTENQAVIYTGIGPVTAQLIAVDDIPVEDSPCVWTLPQCTECGSLTLTFADGTKTAYVGDSKELRLSVIEAGTGQPYESTVLFKDATGGKLTFPTGTSVTTSLPDALTGIITYTTIYPYPTGQISTEESTKAGRITAEVQGEEAICSDYVTLLDNICRIITVKAQLGETEVTNPTSLNGEEIYRLSSSATFASATPDGTQINYKATTGNIVYGYFAKETTVNIAGLDISVPDLDLSAWSSDLTVLQNEGVYFFVNPQLIPATYNDVIRVSVVGTQVPGCIRLIDLIVPAKIDCTSIVLNPTQENFDPTEKTQITIDPNLSAFGDYDGDFIFEITEGTDGADLYISADAETGGKSLIRSMAEATTTGVYIIASGGVTVEVYAADSFQADKGCKAVLRYSSAECKQLTIGYNKEAFIPSAVTSIWIEDNPEDLGGYTGDFVFEIIEGDNAYLSTDTVQNAKLVTVSYAKAISGIDFKGELESTTIRVYAATDPDCIGIVNSEYNEEGACQDLIITSPDGDWEIDRNGDDENFKIMVIPENSDWIIDWKVTENDGYFRNSTTTGAQLTNKVYDVEDNTKVVVSVRGHEDPCSDFRVADRDGGSSSTSTSPKLVKKVAKGALKTSKKDRENSMNWKDNINLSSAENRSKISYQIYFKSGKNKGVNTVEIWDDSINSSGEITGENELKFLNETVTSNGSLNITDVIIEIDGDEINDENVCTNEDYDEDDNDPCVTTEDEDDDEDIKDIENAFKDGDKLTFKNLANNTDIKIYYEMRVNSAINQDTCKTLDPSTGCGEQFENEAKYKAKAGDRIYEDTASTTVTITCPYIITRSGGDAYFGSKLETGTDIAYCGPQKNISGPIIVPVITPHTIPETGTKTNLEALPTLSSPTHDVCKFSNTTNNLVGYQNALKNFSSSICEMKTEVTEKWDAKAVMDQIRANATRVGRFATQVESDAIFNTNTHGQARSAKIYNFKKDATVNKNGFEISGTHTYIIKGDLNINGNITYNNVDYLNLNDVPSAAFIVLGNIIIDKDVTRIDGIYITTGQFIASNSEDSNNLDSTEKLTVHGGLYGDVSNLFSHRLYVGDIDEDEGSVLIRYSENFLINTPPGLKDLMDITQLKTPY